jgi:hypothetical protein
MHCSLGRQALSPARLFAFLILSSSLGLVPTMVASLADARVRVRGGLEGKAARASPGSVGVNLLFMPTTHDVEIASLRRLGERESRTNGVGSS